MDWADRIQPDNDSERKISLRIYEELDPVAVAPVDAEDWPGIDSGIGL